MEPNNYELGRTLDFFKMFLQEKAQMNNINPNELEVYLQGSNSKPGRTRERKAAGKSKNKPIDVDVVMVVPDFIEEKDVFFTEKEWGDELAEHGIDFSFAHPDEIEKIGGQYLLKLDENVITPLNLFE